MKRFLLVTLVAAAVAALAITSLAQPPDGPPPRRGANRGPGEPNMPPPPDRLFEALDTDHDGALSPQEIAKATESLKKIDDDGDGSLSREELRPPRPPRGPGGEGPGDRGPEGPRGRRPGDGPRGAGPPPHPPARGFEAGPPPLLPPHLRDELELSDAQNQQLDELQKELRAKIEKILTPEQHKRLAELHRRRPVGPPPGRPPRRGGPGDDGDDGPEPPEGP
jgi:EF hand domain-containing protein